MGRLLFNICATSSAIGAVCGLLAGCQVLRKISFKQSPDDFILGCLCVLTFAPAVGAMLGAVPPFGAYVAYRIITDKD